MSNIDGVTDDGDSHRAYFCEVSKLPPPEPSRVRSNPPKKTHRVKDGGHGVSTVTENQPVSDNVATSYFYIVYTNYIVVCFNFRQY